MRVAGLLQGRLVTGIGCGLPGWAIVRWVFNFIEGNRAAGIDDVDKEVRKVL